MTAFAKDCSPLLDALELYLRDSPITTTRTLSKTNEDLVTMLTDSFTKEMRERPQMHMGEDVARVTKLLN